MAERPAIVILDDEPVALSALLDALARRFGADYRVVSHLEADACLQALAAMKSAGEEVALIVSDQWLSGTTGSEVLARAHRIFPAAKRALLVAWGDRTASPTILQGCAFGEIDNYLYKPWSPPEVHLYPLVSEFLAEWTRAFRPGLELAKVVAPDPSQRAHELRELLARNGVPHGFYASGTAGAKRSSRRPAPSIAAFRPWCCSTERCSWIEQRRPDGRGRGEPRRAAVRRRDRGRRTRRARRRGVRCVRGP
jgi:thioredoxin reductase (NADPH)